MKQILALLLIGFALSLCNLSERFKKVVQLLVHPPLVEPLLRKLNRRLRRRQLAGGQQAKWDRQGMSWTVPPNWTEEENESKSFMWRSPGGGMQLR